MVDYANQYVMVYLKPFRNVRNFCVYFGLTVSESEIKPRVINRKFEKKSFDKLDNNIFFGFNPKKSFYLQLILNMVDDLLKYRTMRLILIFLTFSILMAEKTLLKFKNKQLKSIFPTNLMFVIF